MNASCMRRGRSRAFTLIEILVVVSIIVLLIAILLPSLGRARRSARGAACAVNLRSLSLAQMTYADANGERLVNAGEGSYDEQGSWISLLQTQGVDELGRRCPADGSPYFDQPFTAFEPAVLRKTSYGINNYISPTHAPLGVKPLKKLSQIQRPASVVQFVELAETGNHAVADHIHVQEFYKPLTPKATPKRVSEQMPIGRHGGEKGDWSGALNYSFFDGHAEPKPLKSVYEDPQRNQFNPAVAR